MANVSGATDFSQAARQGLGELPGEAARLLALAASGRAEIIFQGKRFEAAEAGGKIGVFSPAAAAALAARGLARLERRGGQCRLALTDAGRRLTAEAEPEGAISPERARHLKLEAAVVDSPGGPSAVWRNAWESPLDWLSRRGKAGAPPLISLEQHEAGSRLRRDFHAARMSPRLGVEWSPTAAIRAQAGPGGAHISERVAASRQRVRKALKAAGPELSGLLLDLCCFGKGLELIESERRWPKRSAKLVARIALAALARHYGIEGEARGAAQAKQGQVWREEPRGALFPVRA